MRTESYKRTDIEESWVLLDAKGKTLGRFATEVANILSGKNKPEYTPNADMGDYVIVVNANDINVTGKKLDQNIKMQVFLNLILHCNLIDHKK